MVKGAAGVVVIVDAFTGEVKEAAASPSSARGTVSAAGSDNASAVAAWAGTGAEYLLADTGGLGAALPSVAVRRAGEGELGVWKSVHAGGIRGVAKARGFDLVATGCQNVVLWRAEGGGGGGEGGV